MVHSLVLLSTLFSVCALYYLYAPTMSSVEPFKSNTHWSSPYAGWHSRTSPHPSPRSFLPTRESLQLAVLLNAPVEHEGFTLALFDDGKESVVVDAMGQVLIMQRQDFDALVSLGKEALLLPDTGAFRNTWVVRHDITGRPIDRIFVPVSAVGQIREISVQGFDEGKRALKVPIGDIKELPDVLWHLAGLTIEGREGYERGKADENVVRQVKDILGDIV